MSEAVAAFMKKNTLGVRQRNGAYLPLLQGLCCACGIFFSEEWYDGPDGVGSLCTDCEDKLKLNTLQLNHNRGIDTTSSMLVPLPRQKTRGDLDMQGSILNGDLDTSASWEKSKNGPLKVVTPNLIASQSRLSGTDAVTVFENREAGQAQRCTNDSQSPQQERINCFVSKGTKIVHLGAQVNLPIAGEDDCRIKKDEVRFPVKVRGSSGKFVRFSIAENITLTEFRKLITEGIGKWHFQSIYYRDNEGDLIHLTTDLHMTEALHLLAQGSLYLLRIKSTS